MSIQKGVNVFPILSRAWILFCTNGNKVSTSTKIVFLERHFEKKVKMWRLQLLFPDKPIQIALQNQF